MLQQMPHPGKGLAYGSFHTRFPASVGLGGTQDVRSIRGIAEHVLAFRKNIRQAVPDSGRHQTAAAPQSLKHPEIQIAVLTVVQHHPRAGVKLTVVTACDVKPRKPLPELLQKRRTSGQIAVYRANEHAVAVPDRFRLGRICGGGEGWRPPHPFRRKPAAGKKMQMIAQRNEAGIKSLCVKRLP